MQSLTINAFRPRCFRRILSDSRSSSSRSLSYVPSFSFSGCSSNRYAPLWGLFPSLLVGFTIGWCYKDVTTTLKGNSMSPTLQSGERVLLIPSYLLRLRHSLFPHLFPEHVVEGDVAIIRISKTLSVCKRVIKILDNETAMTEWETNYFSSSEDYLQELEDYEKKHFHSRTVDHTRESNDSPTSQENCDLPNNYPPPLPTKPFRAFQWDQARETASENKRTPSQKWIWLEGDNKSDSFDSRKAGSLPMSAIQGKVIGVLFPNPRLL